MKRFSSMVAFAVALLTLGARPAAAVPYALDNLSCSSVTAGGTSVVHVNAFRARSSVAVDLIAADGSVASLGSLTSDEVGVVEGEFTVPAATAIGSYTVKTSGPGNNGGTRTVTFTLSVALISACGFPVQPLDTVVLGVSVGKDGLPTTGSDPSSLVAFGFGSLLLGAGALAASRASRARRWARPI
jgi:LPXTG-motif cell wall-anchored protein